MTLIFKIVSFAWFLSEVLLNRILRSKITDRQNTDKNSLLLIWVTIIVTMFIAVWISMRFYLPIFQNPSYQYVGIIVIVLGMIIRLAAVLSLGRFFTVDVTIRQGHQLKKDGLYRYLRHPSYFASLLSFIGFGISLNNWLSLLMITVAIIIVFSIRIRIEEKLLTEQFGPEYLEYKKATRGLIPFIY